MTSIKKIDYELLLNPHVSEQPIIKVGVLAEITITMKDGRKFEDVEVCWDSVPQILYTGDIAARMTEEEIDEINERINDPDYGLWESVNRFTKKISEMTEIGILTFNPNKEI